MSDQERLAVELTFVPEDVEGFVREHYLARAMGKQGSGVNARRAVSSLLDELGFDTWDTIVQETWLGYRDGMIEANLAEAERQAEREGRQLAAKVLTLNALANAQEQFDENMGDIQGAGQYTYVQSDRVIVYKLTRFNRTRNRQETIQGRKTFKRRKKDGTFNWPKIRDAVSAIVLHHDSRTKGLQAVQAFQGRAKAALKAAGVSERSPYIFIGDSEVVFRIPVKDLENIPVFVEALKSVMD